MTFDIIIKETGVVIGEIKNAIDADHASDMVCTMYPDNSTQLTVKAKS